MSLYQKKLNDLNIEYKHVLRHGLKNIYIKITKDGEVVLKSSPVMADEAKRFIYKKKDWIDAKLREVLYLKSRANR
ncbi:MAG: DUF45 domain-containing protein, partial [Epsilonproteobacteria bacterium]|nr:DUF45 domain-containing protein [Campylobacterota bacterium]